MPDVNFSEKFLSAQKWARKAQDGSKIKIYWVYAGSTLKSKGFMFFYFSVQTPYLQKFNKVIAKMLLSSHIAGSFDHQFIWKESSNIFGFLFREKYDTEITHMRLLLLLAFVICPDMPSIPQICLDFLILPWLVWVCD